MNKEHELEKKEARRIIQNGFDFNCEYDITKKTWYGKKRTEHRIERFHIAEPTLGTLDRISEEFVSISDILDFDQSCDINEAKNLVVKYARTACRAIAIAVVGNDWHRLIEKHGIIYASVINKRIDELTEVFLHCIKPSELKDIMMYIMATMNLGDFLASIMLMSAQRTTRPNMVEQKTQA